MTAGKRRELRELETSLKVVENTEPAQLLEEERLRKDCRTAGEDRPGAVYRHVRPALQELRKTP